MGYESQLYIIEQSKFTYDDKYTNERKVDIYNRIIGTYDLCKMGDQFDFDIFDEELEGTIFIDGNEVDKDCYGEHLRYCDDLSTLIAELQHCEKKSHYRRLNPIIAMLKSFNKMKNEYKKLIVVHFGY